MTAFRLGFSSARLCLIAAVLLASAGCNGAAPAAVVSSSPSAGTSGAASPGAGASPSQAVSPSPLPTTSASASAQPSAPVSPAVFVGCLNSPAGANTVLLGQRGALAEQAIYDVSDPVHPRLLCRVLHTSAHLNSVANFQYLDPRSATETDIMLRAFDGGSATLTGRLPGSITSAVWAPNGMVAAFTVGVDSYTGCPASAVQVWTYQAGASRLLTTYCVGIGDCICRFGLPGPVLAVSPDGQYLVEGWLAGKGSTPMGVYRLTDRVRVASLPSDTTTAIWDRGADQLFIISFSSVKTWTPGGAMVDVSGAAPWSFYPNMSPGGGQVVYTAYSDAIQGTMPRVYLYDLAASKSRMLIDQPRSQVVFVKPGWVWYFEEQPCADCPNNTESTGKVIAMNLATGVEQQVTFRMDETVTTELFPGEFWPSS